MAPAKSTSIPVGKALTTRGTTDMDRIAAAIIKDKKAQQKEENEKVKLAREQAEEAKAEKEAQAAAAI
jgi:hypothetical protein